MWSLPELCRPVRKTENKTQRHVRWVLWKAFHQLTDKTLLVPGWIAVPECTHDRPGRYSSVNKLFTYFSHAHV